MAFFALIIFAFALLFTYARWDATYKAMLRGGKVLPVAAWMAANLSVWIGGVYVFSALL